MFHSVKRFWNEPLSQKILDGLRHLWILLNHVSPKNNTLERLVIRIGNPKALMTLITNQKLLSVQSLDPLLHRDCEIIKYTENTEFLSISIAVLRKTGRKRKGNVQKDREMRAIEQLDHIVNCGAFSVGVFVFG